MSATITMLKKIELPEAFESEKILPNEAITLTIVFDPAKSISYLTLENISVSGALMLLEKGALAQLKTTLEHINIAAGE